MDLCVFAVPARPDLTAATAPCRPARARCAHNIIDSLKAEKIGHQMSIYLIFILTQPTPHTRATARLRSSDISEISDPSLKRRKDGQSRGGCSSREPSRHCRVATIAPCACYLLQVLHDHWCLSPGVSPPPWRYRRWRCAMSWSWRRCGRRRRRRAPLCRCSAGGPLHGGWCLVLGWLCNAARVARGEADPWTSVRPIGGGRSSSVERVLVPRAIIGREPRVPGIGTAQ